MSRKWDLGKFTVLRHKHWDLTLTLCANCKLYPLTQRWHQWTCHNQGLMSPSGILKSLLSLIPPCTNMRESGRHLSVSSRYKWSWLWRLHHRIFCWKLLCHQRLEKIFCANSTVFQVMQIFFKDLMNKTKSNLSNKTSFWGKSFSLIFIDGYQS